MKPALRAGPRTAGKAAPHARPSSGRRTSGSRRQRCPPRSGTGRGPCPLARRASGSRPPSAPLESSSREPPEEQTAGRPGRPLHWSLTRQQCLCSRPRRREAPHPVDHPAAGRWRGGGGAAPAPAAAPASARSAPPSSHWQRCAGGLAPRTNWVKHRPPPGGRAPAGGPPPGGSPGCRRAGLRCSWDSSLAFSGPPRPSGPPALSGCSPPVVCSWMRFRQWRRRRGRASARGSGSEPHRLSCGCVSSRSACPTTAERGCGSPGARPPTSGDRCASAFGPAHSARRCPRGSAAPARPCCSGRPCHRTRGGRAGP
mmetsp:Transcript_100536/g.313342  ORF Transcript_100536/g.313342 Transcript_100536/m.313342 type:complete len:313 (+) Transcript_100536:649-1587(+)